ncbi:MAG: hypothetical protein QOG06_1255 [Gaiellaceae bacterium]|jgi:hypothetical protein|nr:hypothetical protein [Gaiellaceae bacterium]
MVDHDDLLQQGPHEAPEPETAEQRSKRVGWGSAAGGAAAGGLALAKIGGFGKLLLWLILWHGAFSLWRLGGWIAIALAAGAVATYAVIASRRKA